MVTRHTLHQPSVTVNAHCTVSVRGSRYIRTLWVSGKWRRFCFSSWLTKGMPLRNCGGTVAAIEQLECSMAPFACLHKALVLTCCKLYYRVSLCVFLMHVCLCCAVFLLCLPSSLNFCLCLGCFAFDVPLRLLVLYTQTLQITQWGLDWAFSFSIAVFRFASLHHGW